MLSIFQQTNSRRPFETPSRHGSLDFQSIQTRPARVDFNANFNKELVTVADPCSIGEISVHLTPKLTADQKRNEFIKDKYDIFDDNHSDIKLTDDYFEYEQGQANIIVKGRLKTHANFWRSIGCYDFILDTIVNGYRIPFYTTPPSAHLRNNRSALNHSDFVEEAINDLLIRGLVVECTEQPIVINPLTVSIQNNGKKRLILDLRHVNHHLWKCSVKFEDIRTAMQFIQANYHCFLFDIHSAYHHIDIYEPHTAYLGFAWTFENKVKFFKFLVLPFGLSSACYIFTKVTRPLIKKWRGEGKLILMYLDDGLGTHQDENICYEMSVQVKQDLIDSGFVPKPEKSTWLPTKTLTFLGYYVDTGKAILKIPDERLKKLFSTIEVVESCILRGKDIPIRTVASFVGQIISMSYVIGNVAYIMTKSISMDIMSAHSWNVSIRLSENSVNQVKFWKDNIKDVNYKHFNSDQSCNTIVYSDASGTGFGGYIVQNPKSTAHGMWSNIDAQRSSTWKELTAVKLVLLSLLEFLKGKRIKWFTDNQNVVSIVKKGSMKADLQDIALVIFNTCLKYNLSLEVEWIPRIENEKADYISRIIDYDDWGVAEHLFLYLDSLWGPHEIDWFASDHNYKLPVFYSRYWNVYSMGIDAFTVDWQGINGWFVPPVCLLLRVLKYIRQCRAYGTVVLPLWKSASFWPFLCPSGDGFISQVIGFEYLPTNKEGFTSGKGRSSVFGNIDLPFRMLALRLDFR